MQKKRFSTKVFSVVLSLLMMLTVIPLVPSITADAAYANEYYYPAGTKYIKDIAMVYYKSSSEGQATLANAVGEGAGNGYVLRQDLTAGTGGDYYVYIGWTWTTNPAEAVRGFRISHNNGTPSSYTQSGVNWYPVNSGVHSWVPQLHGDGCVDTNKGAGGDDIFVYITKDPAFGPPVTNLYRAGSTGDRDNHLNAGWKGVVTFQDNGYVIDLNKGAGGDDLFFVYYAPAITKVNTAALRSAYSASDSFMGIEGYTAASIGELSAARNAAKTIMDAFDNNQGYANYTQTDINNAATRINNALNNLKITLKLNGTINGGDKDQTVEITVGKNKTAQVDLSKYTASKPGANFAGWSKNALSTEGTTGVVTVGFNETYYALFGIELTANFHYLTPDGTLKKETKNIYAMNAASAASTPKPNAKDAVVDGKSFDFLGWRTDTAAAEATVTKTGIYTVYVTDPVVDVYAVYSAPITFTQDANKGEPAVEAEVQTQYLNANTEITKTSHSFTVTDAVLEREGGTFLGWADTTTATAAQYTAGYTFTTTEDITIYAAYKMNFVDVTFVNEDGTTVDTQHIPYGDDATIPEVTLTKAYDEDYHYEFAGWDYTAEQLKGVKTDLTVTAQYTAIEHTYSVSTIDEATCTDAGKDLYTCDCNYSKEVDVEALGHDKSFDPGSPATCTTDGSSDYIVCLRCNLVLQEREILPKLGHDWELYEAQSATCSVGGYEIYICKNNNNHKETRNITSPTGEHVPQTLKGWDADCLNNGKTDGTDCAQCGAILTAQSIILADGHDLIVDKAVAPTCTETGLTEGAHCEDCDYVVAQEEVPALGHDWSDFTAKAATCDEAGYTAGSKCRYCHETKDSIEIPALNHGENGYEVITHDATCTEDGYTEYICAYDAKHNYTVKGEAASGHKGGTATCKDQAVCEKCGESYGKTIAHNYESVDIPATCTSAGYTEYTCTACGDSYKDNETALADHIYNNGVITTEPTCDAEGVKTFTCINCPDSYTETVPAKGHNVDNWTVEGTEAEGDCSDCGEHITADPEDVGLELPECERCGMVHRYNSGIFKYKGIYCSIMYFFRQIANFFKGIA